MNQISTKENPMHQYSSVDQRAVSLNEEQMLDTIQNILYPGSKRESALMILQYCKQLKIDPVQKLIHIVPMKVKNKDGQYEWRDTPMLGIGYYRSKAMSTGVWAGIDEPEYGPSVSKNFGGKTVTFPEWCRVTVYRLVGNERVAFVSKEFWIENYASQGQDGFPNMIWAKRPYAQLAKCAQSQALRLAFPDIIGGHYTSDEMEDKDDFHDVSAKSMPISMVDKTIHSGYMIDGSELNPQETFSHLLSRVISLETPEDVMDYEQWKNRNFDELKRYSQNYANDAKQIANKFNEKKTEILGDHYA